MLAEDRRHSTRLPIVITGICRIDGRQSYPCKTVDLSYYSTRLETAAEAEIGETGIVFLPKIGTLACRVSRLVAQGFAVEFDIRQSSKEMLEIEFFLLERALAPHH